MSGAFDGFLTEPKHARTVAAKVSRRNPYSQNPEDPYVDLIAEGEPFDVTDIRDFDRGKVQIHEVSYLSERGMLFGYGFRYLNTGLLAKRPTLAVPLRTDELPAHLLERLGLT